MNTNEVAVAVAAEEAVPLMERLQVMGMEYGMKILGAVIVLVVGMWIAKLIRKGISKVLEARQTDPTLSSFVVSLLYMAMQIFVIVAALEKLNVKTTSFVAILGAAGLAIGLALQGSLSNFAAGVLMIVFKPIKVGDFVEAGGATGSVVEIGIFTTVLNTLDNKKVIIPNSGVTGANIINYNANGTRRVDLVASISYGDDIDKAKKVLEDILAADSRILKDPAAAVTVLEMADSSVNFAVRPWCTADDYWGVYFDTTEAIKKSFDKEGISIPFPQRDIHVYEHSSNAAAGA